MKKLLFSITKKDFKIDYFSGTGSGGQHRNKHQNCVRLHHPASKAVVTGQSHKERKSNIKEALNNLLKNPKFKLWHSQKVSEIIEEKTIEEKINELMSPENLKIEVRNKYGEFVEENSKAL